MTPSASLVIPPRRHHLRGEPSGGVKTGIDRQVVGPNGMWRIDRANQRLECRPWPSPWCMMEAHPHRSGRGTRQSPPCP